MSEGCKTTVGDNINGFHLKTYSCPLGRRGGYCTLILHNICTIHKDDAVEFDVASDDAWAAFFKRFKRNQCPTCVRYKLAHCTHNTHNRDQQRKRNRRPVGAPTNQRTFMTESLWESLKAGLHDMHVPRAHEHAALMDLRAAAGRVVGNA